MELGPSAAPLGLAPTVGAAQDAPLKRRRDSPTPSPPTSPRSSWGMLSFCLNSLLDDLDPPQLCLAITAVMQAHLHAARQLEHELGTAHGHDEAPSWMQAFTPDRASAMARAAGPKKPGLAFAPRSAPERPPAWLAALLLPH